MKTIYDMHSEQILETAIQPAEPPASLFRNALDLPELALSTRLMESPSRARTNPVLFHAEICELIDRNS